LTIGATRAGNKLTAEQERMSEKQYTDEELQVILREAARLSTDDDQRYSLSDITTIAAGAEIAPEYVTRAVQSLDVTPPSNSVSRLVEPDGQQMVRHVGRAVTQAEVMAAIALARQQLGETGTIHNVGSGSEWRYDSGFSSFAMSVVPDADSTVVRFDARADGRQFVLAFGTIVASAFAGFATASSSSPAVGMIAAAVTLVSVGAAATTWWNRSARATQTKLTAMANAVAHRLGRDPQLPD
jgi:hypothetical protein